MKKLALFALLVPLVVYGGFIDLVQERLERDSSYLSSLMEYKNARFIVEKNKNFFIPYVSANKFSLNTDFENYSLSIPLSIGFRDIAGFDVTVSNNWSYSSRKEEWTESGWALTISRELFSNFDITDLENEMKYISARWKLISVGNEVFVSLANDVFNYHYYTRKLRITKDKIEILENQFESLQKAYEAGTASREEIMQIQRNIYQTTNQLYQISQNLMGALTEYSTDTLNTMLACLERITSIIPSQQEAERLVLDRPDLKAQLMAVEIARRKDERAYQQWLPNPAFSFTVKQDEGSDKGFSLSLGFSFGYNIIDRGERAHSYSSAKDNYTLQQRILNEKIDSLKKSVQKAYLSMKIAESTKKVAELDLQLKKIEYERGLKASAFVSAGDLESARLDVQDAEAELLKANYNLLIARLSLLQALGYDLIRLAGGK